MNDLASITALMSSFGRAFHTENEVHFLKSFYRKEIRLPSINQRHFIQFILPCCQSTSHTG